MTHTVRPFHLTKEQGWAEDQVTQHHLEALYAYGEYVMFVLMWHPVDYTAGLVEKCHECQQDRICKAYRQADQAKCESCFGTTFEGGWRARIIRPALITDRVSEVVDQAPRGPEETNQVTVETISGFTLRAGDFMFRSDNERFQTEQMGEVIVRSGFAHPETGRSIAGTISNARLEAPSSVAYVIPPTPEVLTEILRGDRVLTAHLPPDLADLEEIRGPLLA